jgi:nicotinic acid mononucleotide adenylyltransferase
MSIYISPYVLRSMKRIQSMLDCLHPDSAPQALSISGRHEPRDTVIIFTGSFNPPTIAHLALLKQAQKYAKGHQSMHLYAAFSKQTVDKEHVERPLVLDRVALLQTVLRQRLPEVNILLFNRGLYLEQAQALRASFPRVQRIIFLMGFDKILQIFDPRYYEDRDAALEALFQQAQLLVVPRGGSGADALTELLQRPENRRFARYVHAQPFDATYRDISATQVRQGGALHDHDIPGPVRRFMRETRAYAPPIKRADGREIDRYNERIVYLRRQLGPVS